ncbi:MAG: glycosyltransferase family 39 protein [Kiritimatiellae bacterium]|nr:glycosyltransferase family 39 protein [Kiritimatiellia bacterium]MDD5520694.1 glycosyltransferase family 39 protein [Kiritimatiellia bacterium]
MRNRTTAVMIGISVCLMTYTGIRAYRLPFVHDEGVTYLLFLLNGASSLMDCYSANNHFLNTILMYCSSKLFGNSELALRLPNVLFHAVFMLAVFLFIRRRFSNPVLFISAFLVLNMNPFVLDFFSLARGYGIAMALMMLGIFFFMRGMRKEDRGHRDILAAFWCAGFAAFANLSFLNFLAGILGAYLLADALVRSRRDKNSGLAGIVRQVAAGTDFFYKHIILMLLVLIPVGLNLYKEKALYYGGQSGFWRDTVVSLITSAGYNCSCLPVYVAVIKVLVVFVIVLVVSILALQLMGKLRRGSMDLLLVSLIASVTAAVVLFQHFVFGTPYPIDRTAFHFLLYFGVMCILLAEYFLSSGRTIVRTAAACLLVSLAVGATWHTGKNVNLDHSLVWKYDADIKDMIKDVESDLYQHGGLRKIKFGINWLFEPSINYYYAVKRPTWLPIVTRDGIKGEYDYYYVRPDDREELLKKSVEIVREYPITGNILARKRK